MKKIDLTTKFNIQENTIEFNTPLMNASGVHCVSKEELDKLYYYNFTGSLITKSCTLEKRLGNPQPRYHTLQFGSINSMGLPNNGYLYYIDYIKNIISLDDKDNLETKPIFMSVSGLSIDDNIKILDHVSTVYNNFCKYVDNKENQYKFLVELNLSCPNIKNKPQLGYDFSGLENYLKIITSNFKHPFGVKLPPYFDPAHFDLIAAILNKFPSIIFVTCINSIGNGLYIDIDSESIVIKPKEGLGGIGGSYVLPTALANVREFYKRLNKKYIIGCGGINSGTDVFRHILAGASLVQIGTKLYEEGVECLHKIHDEFEYIMKQKNYTNLEQFRGKLVTNI